MKVLRSFVPCGGGPAAAANARARVVSYNILADELAMTEKHNYCLNCDREWDGPSGRASRLISELEAYNADIICMQECSARHFGEFCSTFGPGVPFNTIEGLSTERPSALAGFHHSAFLPSKRAAAEARTSVTGLATFVRPSAWKPLAVQSVRLGADSVARGHKGSLSESLQAHSESVLMLLLEHVKSGVRLAVGNVHLHWDPRVPHMKAAQAELAARALAAFAKVGGAGSALALCGDFNSVPHLQPEFLPGDLGSSLSEASIAQCHSAVYTLLSTGVLDAAHPEVYNATQH